jgi:hypothetical protein
MATQGWNVDDVADTITFLEAPALGVNNIVVKQYAANASGGTDAFALGAWSDEYGWPSEVEFFSDRLWFAGTPRDPQTIWGSQIVDSDSITFTINARQVNAVMDLVPLTEMLLFTKGGEFLMTGGQDNVVTPTTIAVRPQSYLGTGGLQAKVVGDTAIFVREQGSRVFDIGYRYESEGYRPTDLSVWAEHLVEGRTLLRMEWMPAPWAVLWFVRDDGVMLGCTYMPEQEVIGWHRHDTARDLEGDGVDAFIDAVCLPGASQTETHVLVTRVVNGVTETYLEELAEGSVDDIRDWFYLDSGLTYDGRNGAATTLTLSGGTDWSELETLTLTANATTGINEGAGFQSSDVGDAFTLSIDVLETDAGTGETTLETYEVTVQITAVTSSTVASVVSTGDVPSQLRDVATADWTFKRDTITGLWHLEGREVVILGDASVHPVRVVADGEITLDAPYGVVHVGLPFVAQIETLEINAQGASVRDAKKIIHEVSLLLRNTRGIKVGTKLDLLDEVAQREFESWGAPTQPATGVVKEKVSSQWGENEGVFHVVSDDPLPCEILALVPKAMVSG